MKTIKTAFLLTALTLLLLFIGGALGGRGGMTIALIFAIIMNGSAYFFSDKIALMSSGAQPISREQEPRLYAVMERLAAKEIGRASCRERVWSAGCDGCESKKTV